jgi:uroporphyrinogen decarboxylase
MPGTINAVTSSERINRLFTKGTADRVGLTDSQWGDTLGIWMRQGYPTEPHFRRRGEKRWDEEGLRVEVPEDGEYPEPVPPWKHFGYDMAEAGGWFDWMPLRGVSELVAETDQWEIRRNGAGGALKFWKHKSGTPEHVDFRMTRRAVWETDYRSHLLAADPLRLDAEGNRKSLEEARTAGVWAHFGSLGVWEILRSSLGDLCLLESLLADPGWIRDFVAVTTSFFVTHYALLFDRTGLPDGVWIYDDLGYRNGLFASPAVLGDLVFPYYRDLVAFFHSRGLPVVLHSCGSQLEAMPLIVESGFDALNPMERKARGNDPFAFAEQWGDRIAFVGGLDARVLETNDRETIVRETGAYIDGMKSRRARLVFATDHSISPRVRYDSYRWCLETWRQHCRY